MTKEQNPTPTKTPLRLSDAVKDRLRRLGEARGLSYTAAASMLLERVLVERPELAAEALAIGQEELLAVLEAR